MRCQSCNYAELGSKVGSAPNADHELILHTTDNALLKAAQNWDVIVGANLTEEVTGTTNETYRGGHTTQSWNFRTVEIGLLYTQNCHSDVVRKVNGNVKEIFDSTSREIKGTTNETYRGSHITQSWDTRTVHVGGDHTETSHSGRSTAVIGDWNQSVTGHVKIDGAQVSVKTGAYKNATGPSFELFSSKNAGGIQKLDLTAIKLEKTTVAIAKTSLKVDIVVTKVDNTSFGMKGGALILDKVSNKIAQRAVAILTSGLTKVG
jgi:hypothetical protein